MKVSDVMSKTVISIGADEPVSAAAKLLKRCNLGALPVCDAQQRLRGIVTDRDIVLRCVAVDADARELKVREVMSRGVITAGPGDELARAAKLMCGDQVRRLPVLDEGRLVGMVSLCDLAREGRSEIEASAALAEISANFRRLK